MLDSKLGTWPTDWNYYFKASESQGTPKMVELRVVTFCLVPHFLGEEIHVQRDEIYGSASQAGQIGSKDYEPEALSP